MHRTINHDYTANGKWMDDADTTRRMCKGIDNPSDAIIPAETSLYRVAHKWRFDDATNRYVENAPDAAYSSPWWTTNYYFNEALWAPDPDDFLTTARQAFAIHPAWRSDCSKYASIVTTTDLSVWYGLGKVVVDSDIGTGLPTAVHPSASVLQIYIPGFWEKHKLWSKSKQVIAFETSVRNVRGYQGNLPLGLRPGSV